jgi:hypothetical protein
VDATFLADRAHARRQSHVCLFVCLFHLAFQAYKAHARANLIYKARTSILQESTLNSASI